MAKPRKQLYRNINDAINAVNRLGITSKDEYISRYKEDPMLPSHPYVLYAKCGWTTWAEFTPKPDVFLSYNEASKVVQKYGITKNVEYKKWYKTIPGMPSHPDQTYLNRGWVNWIVFTGQKNNAFYPSYEKAKKATRKLGIKTRKEYMECRHLDPKLPSNPNQMYKEKGWTNWPDYCGRNVQSRYETLEEASAATAALGIRTMVEYRVRHKEDPHLPASPDVFYAKKGFTTFPEFTKTKKCFANFPEFKATVQMLGIKCAAEYRARYKEHPELPSKPEETYKDLGWSGWIDALGVKPKLFYGTYEEASAAAIKLGIKTQAEYLRRYKEDPLLYSSPNKFYAKSGWTSWHEFLGIKNHPPYKTYDQARTAAKALGATGKDSYLRLYKSDPRLVASPIQYYKNIGWKGWKHFTGEQKEFYSEYADAQAAVQSLGIKSVNQYKHRYREDPLLPSAPDKMYAQSGWIDFPTFLGTYVFDATPSYPNICADYSEWLEDETDLPGKRQSLKILINGFFAPLNLPDDPRYLLIRTNPFDAEAYRNLIESQTNSTKSRLHRSILYFFRWALIKYCADEDADELIILPGCRNPFETVLAGFQESLTSFRPNQTTKPPLGYEYILRARNFLVPNSDLSMINRPALNELSHLHEFYNSRLDWVEIDQSLVDREDPNCVWRIETVKRLVDGKQRNSTIFKIWSPVRFIAMYTLLRYPLRGQQIMWLDSGEGDSEIAYLDPEENGVKWQKNNLYCRAWAPKKRRHQGAIQKGLDDSPMFYVTTNKTGIGEGGYEIEWVPDDLCYWLLLLRDWQNKYNPLNEPTLWLNAVSHVRINKKILKARGSQFFLFRDSNGYPLGPNSVYEKILPKLLYEIQRDGEGLAELKEHNRYASQYTPHSLRVSLITAFITDGGAPIHLISKLVGHAALVMTIYYIRVGSNKMRRLMGEIEKRTEQASLEQQAEEVRKSGMEFLSPNLIITDGNRHLVNSEHPNSACVVFDYGICPMSGASCHIGGEAIKEWVYDTIYSPVPPGYLGQKNCPRCRFFVTGVPFLGGLISIANEISLEIYTESERYQHYSSEVDRLEREHYDACIANIPDLNATPRKLAIANMQQSGSKLDSLLNDYTSIAHYVNACLKIINDGVSSSSDSDDIRLISNSSWRNVEVAFEDAKTNYHLLAEICENSTIYSSSNPSRALPLISQAIDRMAENNGMKPAMFRLTDAQKLIVANELNKLLLQRLGSWERIDDLFSGNIMLLDIDACDPHLEKITIQINNILTFASSKAIDLSGRTDDN